MSKKSTLVTLVMGHLQAEYGMAAMTEHERHLFELRIMRIEDTYRKSALRRPALEAELAKELNELGISD